LGLRYRCAHITIGFYLAIAAIVLVSGHPASADRGSRQPAGKRAVSVRDLITMTSVSRGDDAGGEDAIASFSPDQSKAVVVLKRGNLEQNTTEYSLLLWSTDQLSSGGEPQEILNLASSSIRPAISGITWLADNMTLLFLGEHPGELRQLYSLNIRTRQIKKLTNHSTSLAAYSVTPDGQSYIFTAEQPIGSLFEQQTFRHGYVVDPRQTTLENLIRGDTSPEGSKPFADQRLFIGTAASTDVRAVTLAGKILRHGIGIPYISPDGARAVLPLMWKDAPEVWRLSTRHGGIFWRYYIVDLQTGEQHPLINSSLDGVSEAAWSRDSKLVVLSRMFLPITDDLADQEKKMRYDTVYPVAVDIETGRVDKIDPDGSESRLVERIFEGNTVAFCEWDSLGKCSRTVYVRDGARWRKLEPSTSTDKLPPEIVEQQDMNTPPYLALFDHRSGKSTMLLQLNPQFDAIHFSKVGLLTWKSDTGENVKGGLYYPLHYRVGQKYPLVIQTHGFDSALFQPDGPYSSAFAAQPLAARDIMVFQLDDYHGDLATPGEIRGGSEQFDEVINYLDERQMIDRNRVGIVGFSRTGFYVQNALTRSNTTFAAAAIEDNWDGSLWQYLLCSNWENANRLYEQEKYGAQPFGPGLSVWALEDPLLNIQRVRTPLRIVTHNSNSILGAWGWFSGLAILEKPVEMIALSFDAHQLKLPWNREVSLQGNVDWFDFWLNGHHDPAPEKKEQYERWERMKAKVGSIQGKH
jgi:hypothetical protein